MAEFVVNAVLIVALLVLLIIWAVSASRRRNRARREHADDRRLMLAAFTGAAAPAAPAATTSEDEPPPARRAEGSTGGRQPAAVPGQPLDAASVAGLLALLEGHRPALRGVITGLLTSPSSVWSAGARAGQTVGRRTMADQPGPATEASTAPGQR